MHEHQKTQGGSTIAVVLIVVGVIALLFVFACGGAVAFFAYTARQAVEEARQQAELRMAEQQRAAEAARQAGEQMQLLQEAQAETPPGSIELSPEDAARLLGGVSGDLKQIYDQLEEMGVDSKDQREMLEKLQQALDDPDQSEQLKTLLKTLEESRAAPAEPPATPAPDAP